MFDKVVILDCLAEEGIMADNGLEKFVAGMVFGAAMGGAVGAALGLLLAPKPGRETRQIVRERAGEYMDVARERAGEYAAVGRERAGEYLDSARERVQNLRRRNAQGDDVDVDAEPLLEPE